MLLRPVLGPLSNFNALGRCFAQLRLADHLRTCARWVAVAGMGAGCEGGTARRVRLETGGRRQKVSATGGQQQQHLAFFNERIGIFYFLFFLKKKNTRESN